ncbi:heterodisulfide reductase-related iron-sulfur binding cluster [Chloroflexota bacterium]
MIDYKLVNNIREYGTFRGSGEERRQVLGEIGFKLDQKAEYVIISGCVQPGAMPHVFTALKNLLDHQQVSYTALSKEYCCGWLPFGQPAVMAKDEDDIAKSKELSKEFIVENFRQAEALGAKSIALFCSACEPSYSNYVGDTNLEVISYTELLDRHVQGGKLDLDADYYAGCYRFRRRITEEPLDVELAIHVLNKIEGLMVNQLDSKLCCYIPPHLEQLTASIKNKTLITICTGCYRNLQGKLQEENDYQIKMLPEILLEAVT